MKLLPSGTLSLGRIRVETQPEMDSPETRLREAAVVTLESLFACVPAALIIATSNGRILRTNESARQMLGYSQEDLEAMEVTNLVHPDDVAAETAAVQRVMHGHEQRMETRRRTMSSSGQTLRTIASHFSIAGMDGPLYACLIHDITPQVEAETVKQAEAAMYSAASDILGSAESLEQAIPTVLQALCHSSGWVLGAFWRVDVQTQLLHCRSVWQDINETAPFALFNRHTTYAPGHDFDTVARLGGDEFAILLPKTDRDGASLTANRLLEELATPYELAGHNFGVGASVGMAVLPEHGTDATALMQRAEAAMNMAKRAGGGQAIYSTSRDQSNSARLLLTGELRTAIESEQLLLHYQPKVNLSDGRTEHVEALVRWQHPERGLIAPDRFIPLAEETGLVRPLTLWVLNRALSQQRQWLEEGHDVRVAVNVSARILHDPELLSTVLELLVRWGVEPSRLMIEITESAIMVDPDGAMKSLVALHAAGVWTSIDDFGTGYSSLGYLKHLPVDEIKIDKSFVLDKATNRDDVSIVRSVVTLGHNLGLKVVAEGVDNKRTLDMLGAMDCDMAQGFYLSRPLPASEMLAWLDGATGPVRRVS